MSSPIEERFFISIRISFLISKGSAAKEGPNKTEEKDDEWFRHLRHSRRITDTYSGLIRDSWKPREAFKNNELETLQTWSYKLNEMLYILPMFLRLPF